jgi:isochorismate pyruvate lyase
LVGVTRASGGRPRDDLVGLRQEIDAVDEKLVALLAERFRIVERVIEIKARDGLPAHIPERVEAVVGAARALAGARDVPPGLAEAVWRSLVAWTIAYEEEQLAACKGR